VRTGKPPYLLKLSDLRLPASQITGLTSGVGPVGPTGPQGIQGVAGPAGTGSAVIVDNLTTGGTNSALSAQQGIVLSQELIKRPIANNGKNLFNKANVIAGYVCDQVGNLIVNSAYNLSDYIDVVPGTQYYGASILNGMRMVTFYNATKQIVAGGSNSEIFTFTVPATAVFVRVSVYVSNQDTFQLEIGSAATLYQPYGRFLSFSQLSGTVPPSMLLDEGITPLKTNFLKRTKNLFNKATVTLGIFQGIAGIPTTSSTYNVSDFIQITPGVQYFGRSGSHDIRMLTVYNAAKQVIPGGSDNNITTFTPPTGAAYVKITVYAASQDTFQLEIGSSATAYSSFGYKLETTAGEPIFSSVETASVSTNKWAGKAWYSIGDSINAAGNWQALVVSVLGLTHVNLGLGGSRLSGSSGDATAMCQNTRINAAPTTADLITLSPGTNDWAQSVPMGALDSTDPLTFNGAFNTFMVKAMARWPSKRVIVGTTPYGEIVDYVPRTGWTSVSTNALGFTTRDYAAALIVQCNRWGIPYADISGRAGWNSLNIQSYMTEPDRLHPSSAGATRMGSVWIATFKNNDPLI
jgi:lysophospholipase L1-like esterase